MYHNKIRITIILSDKIWKCIAFQCSYSSIEVTTDSKIHDSSSLTGKKAVSSND